ncbi:hypothetical protein DICA4_F18272 [Diutina catenulata]
MASTRPNPRAARVTNVTPMDSGKWIQTRRIDYKDAVGGDRVWEMAVRTTRGETGVDAVSICSVLKGKGAPQIVLVRQFRPPANACMIEMPAGLVDPKEPVEKTAVRELLEETGYHGTCTRTTPVMYSDPGLSNANMVMAYVDVDLTDPRNEAPQQQLDDGEYIEVFTVPVASLRQELDQLKEQGDEIDSRLYHFAAGIEFAGQM